MIDDRESVVDTFQSATVNVIIMEDLAKWSVSAEIFYEKSNGQNYMVTLRYPVVAIHYSGIILVYRLGNDYSKS